MVNSLFKPPNVLTRKALPAGVQTVKPLSCSLASPLNATFSAAVLDRLNSCLESDGRLVISERQSSFEPLEPHPNFRWVFYMNMRFALKYMASLKWYILFE